jgi:hypothetical protein
MMFKQNLGKSSEGRCSFNSATKKILLLIPFIVFIACYERDMSVSVAEHLPPTFKLSGSGNLAFFSVSEVAKENQHRIPFERDSDKDTVLWQIWPDGLTPEAKALKRLPPIIYGVVPPGFRQKIPSEGTPPSLIEGKIYDAGGPASNANGGFVWFTIKKGKVVKVDAPGGY